MKEATVIIEGNQHREDQVIHELQKLVSEANSMPEVDATLQTSHYESDDGMDVDTAFGRAEQ